MNKGPLLLVALANLAVLILLIHGGSPDLSDWNTTWKGLQRLIPAGTGLILVGILNAQLSGDMKARIVFARWHHPLPGAEAFTRLAHTDDRIDLVTLKKVVGAFPTNPRDQSSLWYRLYKSVGDDKSVVQVHREFLFTRDYACIALMLALLFGPIGLFEISSPPVALMYWGLLFVQFALVARAARVHGRRLVTTVLALKSAGK